jgi:hypothetical protein
MLAASIIREIIKPHKAGGTERNQNTSLRGVGFRVEIRSLCFSNMKQIVR